MGLLNFWSSDASANTALAPATPSDLTSDMKPAGEAAAKVKPCCVCKDEKASRDDCMLYSQADDPQEDCKSMVDKYRSCMAGYGFKI